MLPLASISDPSNTAFSIELNSTVSVPEWGGQRLRFKLEEDAFFDGEKVRYIDGRQTELMTIPRMLFPNN